MRLLALLLLLPSIALADGGHSPKPTDTVHVQDRRGMCDGGARPLLCVLGVAGTAVGIYYVVRDPDECSSKVEAPKPAAAPVPATPPKKVAAKPRQCDLPARPRPVTTLGLGAIGTGAVGFVVGHEF